MLSQKKKRGRRYHRKKGGCNVCVYVMLVLVIDGVGFAQQVWFGFLAVVLGLSYLIVRPLIVIIVTRLLNPFQRGKGGDNLRVCACFLRWFLRY